MDILFFLLQGKEQACKNAFFSAANYEILMGALKIDSAHMII